MTVAARLGATGSVPSGALSQASARARSDGDSVIAKSRITAAFEVIPDAIPP
jgi:hypothetical protein